MRRRFIADTWTPDRTAAALTGDQAYHLANVLRAQPGLTYDLVAGGFLHCAVIDTVSDTEVRFTLHEELEAAAALPVHLLLAIFKFDHFEWAIEKATELGVARVTPILARRTEKHLAQASAKRVERWRRIAHEAAKQSRRTDIPKIANPIALKLTLEAEVSPHRILLSETEQSVTLSDVLKSGAPHLASEMWVPNYALAIGPEGGWTPDEMALFPQHGWQPVTLGPRILRAETAAIAAIAILGAHLLTG